MPGGLWACPSAREEPEGFEAVTRRALQDKGGWTGGQQRRGPRRVDEGRAGCGRGSGKGRSHAGPGRARAPACPHPHSGHSRGHLTGAKPREGHFGLKIRIS